MALTAEDLDNPLHFRKILTLSYSELIPFIFDYLKRRSALMVLFWTLCIVFLGPGIFIRINISGIFPFMNIVCYSLLGLIIFPLIIIPLHEFLHIIPFFISGARNIRVGMDLKQYLFWVTAHRYVATPRQFITVAIMPFLIISLVVILLILYLPGLWKWSLSLFLFVHATMCAGDFALLNFYFMNRNKKIYTWDDADKKEAYFYEKIE
jgi:hypothetical protein